MGLAAVVVVAFTLLRDGRKSGWFTLLAVLVLGGSAELVAAGTWFEHGSPFYEALGEGEANGMGWQLLGLPRGEGTSELAC